MLLPLEPCRLLPPGKLPKLKVRLLKLPQEKEKKALKGFEKGQAQIETDLGQVQAPVYNPYADIPVAEAFSASLLKQQEAALPGAAAQRQRQLELVNQAMGVLSQGLKGEYGEDLKQTVMRDVAQFAGAGFNPATAGRAGGFQASQGFGAAQLGRTARDVQMESLAAMPGISNVALGWQELANRFRVSPDDVSRTSLAYQMGAADVGLRKVGIKADLLSSVYGAQTGAAQRGYGRQKENIAASLARDLQFSDTVEKGSAAVGSAVAGGAGAYGQYATAANASTTPMSSGFYRGEVGAANAYGVAPSQLSYQKPSGGFMGIGGQGGGYYYTPGGVYGRA